MFVRNSQFELGLAGNANGISLNQTKNNNKMGIVKHVDFLASLYSMLGYLYLYRGIANDFSNYVIFNLITKNQIAVS